MDRRSSLKMLAAACAVGHAQPQLADQVLAKDSTNDERILVIGAGLAGLAAARQLKDHGYDVFVIEARDRIGGRIWTSTKWPDMPLDLGASWIHGMIGNPITELAKEAKATLVNTSYDRNIIYDTDGKELSDAKSEQLAQLQQQFEQAMRRAQEADRDVSIQSVVDRLLRELNASDETKHMLNFLICGSIEHEYAGSVRNMSAQWYDSSDGFDGEDALFPGGYHQIVKRLATGLDIRIKQIVQRIDWSGAEVRVVTDKAEFQADRVIVTLPLGVLKANRVEFQPKLPAATIEAITRLDMGTLNKCYLLFPKIFWPEHVDWIEYIPERNGEWVEWVSFARTSKLPVLLGLHAADEGRKIEKRTDAEIVASGMDTLRTIFGQDIPQPVDHQITRWSSDPFALGSYSYYPLGSHPDLRQQLAKPIDGKLYFAGEATESDHFATAHGAYLSGLRAADEIMAE
jgi:monoamine oxidase